jgi:hypothetical protein
VTQLNIAANRNNKLARASVPEADKGLRSTKQQGFSVKSRMDIIVEPGQAMLEHNLRQNGRRG